MKTIVYVDDETALTENFGIIFDEDEFQVHTFNTHIDAQSFIGGNNVDILFLDFRMPEGTAIDFLGNCNPDCKKILLTGELDASVEQGVKESFDLIIEKPFEIDQILEAVS